MEGKLSKPLKKVLKKVIASEAHEKLAVADAKLGQAIKVSYSLSQWCVIVKSGRCTFATDDF